jgi:hypothetical protein
LLNFITQSPIDCPVAVVFGHAGDVLVERTFHGSVAAQHLGNNRLWLD